MDERTIKLVVIALGGIGCLCISGTILLAALGVHAQESLTGIASAAIGALVGILAVPRPPQQPPQHPPAHEVKG